ncbi:MAG: CsbD family protein [Rhodobacteraceae bacterium]|uniref:CsbD family protein n=1 Tax=Amaricoccus sp. B4 TaxID=3368557 RepID=UPI000DAC201E|nr:CsbD family protein [Paracoccaceae bacterium]
MNWDQVKGNWKQFSGKMREQWGELTDDEIAKAEGNREQLVGLIQAKYGRSKEEAEREIDSWLNAA